MTFISKVEFVKVRSICGIAVDYGEYGINLPVIYMYIIFYFAGAVIDFGMWYLPD